MKPSNMSKQSERRNHFRIDDVSILYHRVLADDEGRHEDNSKAHADQLSIDKLTLKAKFDSLTREMTPLSTSIEQNSPKLARYLAVIDTKLNMLSEILMSNVIEELDEKPQKVNISAGGLSFESIDSIAPGSILELRIILLPSKVGIYSHAKVVMCNKIDDKPESQDAYKVAVEFIRLEEEFRDQITRHVLGREQATLISNQKIDKES